MSTPRRRRMDRIEDLAWDLGLGLLGGAGFVAVWVGMVVR